MDKNISKKRIKIFVVDSGIDTNISDLTHYVRESTGFGINKESYISEDKTREVKNIHGTAVSLIIRDIFKEVEFTSVNILDEDLTTDARILIYALCCCIEKKPDIIHLSLGTRKFFYSFALRKIVKEACKNKISIVSALDNIPGRSYPAYLKGVFGVKGEILSEKEDFYFDNRFWVAPIGVDGVSGMNELACKNINMMGNSMAAAYITGHIARTIYQYGCKDFKSINNHMKSITISKDRN